MSRALQVSGLVAGYGSGRRPVPVLHGIDLDVAEREFLSVLGVSGSGKTTLLRVIAGLHPAVAGRVVLGGRDLRGVKPERRRVGLVPQEGALFGHLTVAANIGYGLRRLRAAERAARVAELVAAMELDGLAARMPHQLSGGQRQRVALARALAPAPDIVLLDEPFAGLDATLRATVRAEVVAALRATGTAAVLITHDQQEALSTSDRVAVLHEGRFVQVAAPQELYRAPASPWVATFVGTATLVSGHSDGAQVATALGVLRHAPGPAGHVTAVVRPEQVALTDPRDGPVALVTACEFLGHDQLVRFTLPDGTAGVARTAATGAPPRPGQAVGVDVTAAVHVIPSSTTQPVEELPASFR